MSAIVNAININSGAIFLRAAAKVTNNLPSEKY